jgi:hypothetical protein
VTESERSRNPAKVMCFLGGRRRGSMNTVILRHFTFTVTAVDKQEYECVLLGLAFQYAKRMRRVACLALPHFFHIISSTAQFSWKKLLTSKSVFIFSTTQRFKILRRIQRYIAINIHLSSSK